MNGPGDGATFIMREGWILCTGANTSEIIDAQTSSNTGGGVSISGVSVNNLGINQRWSKGSGRVSITDLYSYNTTNNPKLDKTTNNKLLDGGFEESAVLDAFIFEDTAAITSRVTGTNIKLTNDSAYYLTGAKSMKAAKTYGSGSAASFFIAVPLCRKGSISQSRFYYTKTGAGTGNVSFTFAYARIVDSPTVPAVQKRLTIGASTVTFGSSAVGWTAMSSGEPFTAAPSWANYYIIGVNMTSFVGPDSLYFDDAEVYEY